MHDGEGLPANLKTFGGVPVEVIELGDAVMAPPGSQLSDVDVHPMDQAAIEAILADIAGDRRALVFAEAILSLMSLDEDLGNKVFQGLGVPAIRASLLLPVSATTTTHARAFPALPKGGPRPPARSPRHIGLMRHVPRSQQLPEPGEDRRADGVLTDFVSAVARPLAVGSDTTEFMRPVTLQSTEGLHGGSFAAEVTKAFSQVVDGVATKSQGTLV